MYSRLWRKFDFWIVGFALLLVIYGVAMIASATRGSEDLHDLWRTQLIRAGIGFGLLLVVAAIDYRFYRQLYKPMYFVILVTLAILFIVGELTQGTLRWIGPGGTLQPSEPAKIVLIITLAKILSDHDGQMGYLRYVLLSLLVIVPPVLLVFLQPNLSTSIILIFIWLIMGFVAGVRLFHLGLLAGVGALFTPALWLMLEDYMRERVLLFLNPASNPDDYYNVQQALISIGSGGWLGKGFGNGSQSQLRFLRVRHTDFIFSVIGEELGMLGGIVLFVLIILLLWRILRAADLAADPFGRLICTGVAAVIFVQAFVNVGVNLGLLPVTGTPLPFVSYGSSSLFTLLIALGLVESVLMRRKRLDFE
ncbi:MAG: FtsW/RodA/SpoVE family cell cycle protein [Anaerolineae bacterium]